ncbi:MAG: Bacteriochlorophyll/chlorophyll synthetase [Candidatus Moranbacteria bacterium GW2011_GWE1_35_17]|nr:MAG: Bacteriochlorophyll/chlorophyll synthetase [Candidatus Moranbacteria bacterium GW2011_GWE1_35_17]
MVLSLKDLIKKIENSPTSFYIWLCTFLGIITARILMENWLDGMVSRTGNYFFHHVAYTFFFFLLTYLILLGLLIKNLKIKIKIASNVLIWGYLIIIFPPLIDFILFKDKLYLSFYGVYSLAEMPRRFFTFFGDSPDFGVTYGVRFEIAMAVIALGIYGYLKTKSKIRGLFLALQTYIILFVLGTSPSWATIAVKGFSKGFMQVKDMDIVQLFFTSARLFSRETGNYTNALSIKISLVYAVLLAGLIILGLFFYYKDKFISFLKNSRPVQLIYHAGLLFVGMGLGISLTEINWDFSFFNFISFLNIVIAISLAWLASVVFNDIFDKKIDKVTNDKRPLIVGDFRQDEYITIGVVLFAFSILYAALINPKIALLLLAYQMLAWLYSAWPLRLKRFTFLSTFISALASLLVIFAGFILVTFSQDIIEFPKRIFWLMLFSLTLALPIKDLKDIKGDKLDGVATIPVVFGEYWGKIIIGSGIFLSYFLSVILLNESRLLLWAIIVGGLSFWVVTSSGENKKISNRNLIWWVMGLVIIYLAVLIKLVVF